MRNQRASSARRLKFLLALMPHRIRKIAIKAEAHVLDLRIDAEMQAFNGFAPATHAIEGGIELRHVLEFHHQMEVTICGGRQPELAPRQPPTLHLAAGL